jgi:heme/copper-type cytochrome/quinol oxidase subunit 2
MWTWSPVLRLRRGVQYTLHLSSLDVNHGFSLFPLNINIQVVPGYDYGLRVTPNEAGDFRLICNEFCGIGHHAMVGRVIVVDGEAPVGAAPGGVARDAGGPRTVQPRLSGNAGGRP